MTSPSTPSLAHLTWEAKSVIAGASLLVISLILAISLLKST